MARINPYDIGLEKSVANYTPLTPLSLLARTAYVYPDRVAMIHGDWRLTWSEVYARCRRLASALVAHGVGEGDTVAAMLPNVPAMYEAHFGVPMTLTGNLTCTPTGDCADPSRLPCTSTTLASILPSRSGHNRHRKLRSS